MQYYTWLGYIPLNQPLKPIVQNMKLLTSESAENTIPVTMHASESANKNPSTSKHKHCIPNYFAWQVINNERYLKYCTNKKHAFSR